MYTGRHHKLKDTFIVFGGGRSFRKFMLQIMSLIETTTTTKPSKSLLLSSQHLMTLNLLVENMKQLHTILYETSSACENVIYSICNSLLYHPSYFFSLL